MVGLIHAGVSVMLWHYVIQLEINTLSHTITISYYLWLLSCEQLQRTGEKHVWFTL
jgi:hypothetical protein